jgi:hypothetical protein
MVAYENEIQRKLDEMTPPEQRQSTAPALKNVNKARGIKRRGQEAIRQA